MDNWIDLSNVPKKQGNGKHKNGYVYDWSNCINISADFHYNDINGNIIILRKFDESNLLIKYDKKEYIIHHQSLIKCRLGRVLNKGYNLTKENIQFQKENRFGLIKKNNQGCLMKIVEYNTSKNIIVEFQDDYHYRVKTKFINFTNGNIKNPYFTSVFGIGIIGNEKTKINGVNSKEYEAWHDILKRCYSQKLKEMRPTYIGVECCKEWLIFENFCKWLRKQDNYEKWLNTEKWAVDKDILIKWNKVYSPDTCCLVSPEINSLFTKRQNCRGKLPIGVIRYKNKYEAQYNNGTGKSKHLGYYDTPIEAFQAYKIEKEKHIKEVAIKSYNNNDITKRCYEAMMSYVVEITD